MSKKMIALFLCILLSIAPLVSGFAEAPEAQPTGTGQTVQDPAEPTSPPSPPAGGTNPAEPGGSEPSDIPEQPGSSAPADTPAPSEEPTAVPTLPAPEDTLSQAAAYVFDPADFQVRFSATPEQGWVLAGETLALTAELALADVPVHLDAVLPEADSLAFAWSSGTPDVAAVDPQTGIATGLATGAAQVSVSVTCEAWGNGEEAQVAGLFQFQVLEGEAASDVTLLAAADEGGMALQGDMELQAYVFNPDDFTIRITPVEPTWPGYIYAGAGEGDWVQYQAKLLPQMGRPTIAQIPQGCVVAWSVADPLVDGTVISVDQTGLVTAKGEDSFVGANTAASITVTITCPGEWEEGSVSRDVTLEVRKRTDLKWLNIPGDGHQVLTPNEVAEIIVECDAGGSLANVEWSVGGENPDCIELIPAAPAKGSESVSIKGLSSGNCTLSAKSSDESGNGPIAEIQIFVRDVADAIGLELEAQGLEGDWIGHKNGEEAESFTLIPYLCFDGGLKAAIAPSEVTWESHSDYTHWDEETQQEEPNATVSIDANSGKVTAASGWDVVQIDATYTRAPGDELQGGFWVEVRNVSEVPDTVRMVISPAALTLQMRSAQERGYVRVHHYPVQTAHQRLTWEIEDPKIARIVNVDPWGWTEIEAVKAGTTTLTVKSASKLVKTCEIVVHPQPVVNVWISCLEDTSAEMHIPDANAININATDTAARQRTFEAHVHPADAEETITWLTTDPTMLKIISVSDPFEDEQDDKVYRATVEVPEGCNKPGKVSIIAVAANGVYDQVELTLYRDTNMATGFRLVSPADGQKIQIMEGVRIAPPVVEFTPAGSYGTIVWQEETENGEEPDRLLSVFYYTGGLQGNGPFGPKKVVGTLQLPPGADPVTQSYWVEGAGRLGGQDHEMFWDGNVPYKLLMNGEDIEAWAMKKGETAELDIPEEVRAKGWGFEWFNDNPKVVSMSQDLDGKVTLKGLAEGEAEIILRVKNDPWSNFAKCRILVWKNATGIKLSKKTLRMWPDGYEPLTVTMSPTTSFEPFTCVSDHPEVAKYEDGYIRSFGKPGIATITFWPLFSYPRQPDGSMPTTVPAKLKAVCTVSVGPDGEMRMFTSEDPWETDVREGGVSVAKNQTDAKLWTKMNWGWGHGFDHDDHVPGLMVWTTPKPKVVDFLKDASGKIVLDNDGKVTLVPKAVGTAVITAKNPINGCVATCTVVVHDPASTAPEATRVTVTKPSITLKPRAKQTVALKVEPKGAKLPKIIWDVANEEEWHIAQISPLGGIIVGGDPGQTQMVGVFPDHNDWEPLRVNVTVLPSTAIFYLYDKTPWVTGIGETSWFDYYMEPWMNVTWSSSNIKVVTVNPNTGVALACGLGKANIYGKTPDGKKIVKPVVVLDPADELSVPSTNMIVALGATFAPKVTRLPNKKSTDPLMWNWDYGNYMFQSSGNTGKFKTLHLGRGWVHVEALYGGGSTGIEVHVVQPAKTIKLNITKATLKLNSGGGLALKPTLTGENTEILQWSSSNPAVARVTPSGMVYAVGAGKATITCQGATKKVTCAVTVIP